MMEDEPEEEGGIVEYCGLIVGPVPRRACSVPDRYSNGASSFQGLFILLLIIAILVWAYYQDQKAGRHVNVC